MSNSTNDLHARVLQLERERNRLSTDCTNAHNNFIAQGNELNECKDKLADTKQRLSLVTHQLSVVTECMSEVTKERNLLRQRIAELEGE